MYLLKDYKFFMQYNPSEGSPYGYIGTYKIVDNYLKLDVKYSFGSGCGIMEVSDKYEMKITNDKITFTNKSNINEEFIKSSDDGNRYYLNAGLCTEDENEAKKVYDLGFNIHYEKCDEDGNNCQGKMYNGFGKSIINDNNNIEDYVTNKSSNVASCSDSGGTGFDENDCSINGYEFKTVFTYEKNKNFYEITNSNEQLIAEGTFVNNTGVNFAYNSDGTVSIIEEDTSDKECVSYKKFDYTGHQIKTSDCVVGLADNYVFVRNNDHIKLKSYNGELIKKFDIDLNGYSINYLGWNDYDKNHCNETLIVLLESDKTARGVDGYLESYTYNPSTDKFERKVYSDSSDFNGHKCGTLRY